MTKTEASFEVWFDNLTIHVLDLCGIEFRDKDSVRAEYEDGKDLFDVAADIADEYAD